ncbi:hypothetical protein DYB34_008950, partial [Aphanomyces astaci]
MKRPPATPKRPMQEDTNASDEEASVEASQEDTFGNEDESPKDEECEMLTREELDAMMDDAEGEATTKPSATLSRGLIHRMRSRSTGQLLLPRRSRSLYSRSSSSTADYSSHLRALSNDPKKAAPSPTLPPRKDRSLGKKGIRKMSSRWDDVRTQVKGNPVGGRDPLVVNDGEDTLATVAAEPAPVPSPISSKTMADVAKQVIYSKRASSHLKLNVNVTAGHAAINGLYLEKKKLDLRILSAQFKEVKRSEFYEELVVYCLFLLLFFQLLSGLPFHGSFQQSDVTVDLTCSVPDACSIQSPDDIYTFAAHLKGRICSDSTHPKAPSFQPWTRVGGLFMRQIRVRPEPCQFAFIFGDTDDPPTTDCFPALSGDNQDTAPIVGRSRNYSWSDDLAPWIPGHNSWYGSHTKSFGTGGYVLDLCDTDDDLVADAWMDVATRAVSLEFVVVNPSTHVFTVASHEFMIHPSGHMKYFGQSANLRVMGVEGTSSSSNNSSSMWWALDVRVHLWLGVCAFVLTYFRSELAEVHKMGLTSYLTLHGWNLFELAHLLLLVSTLYYTYVYYTQSWWTREAMVAVPPDAHAVHIRMLQLLDTFLQLSDFAALSSAFSLLKIFKFLRMNSTLNLLWQVLGMALKDLMGYMVIFLLIFLSYSTMGSFAFGFDLEEFSSVWTSFATCFHMLAGDLSYDRLQQANPRLAPVFFVTFVVLVLQVMVNMFVAILSEFYESAKDVGNDEDDVEYDIITRLREFLGACAPTVDLTNTGTILLRPHQTVRLISTNLVDKELTRHRAKKLFRGVVWRIIALLRFGMKFDQKLVFAKTSTRNHDPNRTTRYIPLSENFDHSTIKTMLPKGITIRLEGDAILGQQTLLRVVRHGALSVECVVLPSEHHEDVMELVGGEKLKLPWKLFVFHVVKLIFRELRHGILRATKWWDPYESKIVDDYHLYQLLTDERRRGKATLRFDELNRLLDLYFRKEKRGREYSQDEVRHEAALVMYRFRNSLIDMPSREKEGHDYVPNPVDTSAVE